MLLYNGDFLTSHVRGQMLIVRGYRMVNSKKPRVSIGMPVFNGEKYLTDALNSILAQTFEDFEVIISDNASTDSTQAISQTFVAKDPRIRYYRNQKNIGAMPNFNHAFELSSGEYFKWAAYDDILSPEFLQKSVMVLDQNPSVVLCYSWTKLINDQGEIYDDYPHNGKYNAESLKSYKRFNDIINFSHWCIQDLGLIRASALKKTPLYESYTASDRVLLARLCLDNQFYEIPEYLFYYRRHALQSYNMVNRGPSLLLYAAWNDPAYTNRIMLPVWMLYGGFFKTVNESSLTMYERLRCYLSLLVWPTQNRQAQRMLKDVILAVALTFARRKIRQTSVQ